ncbi:MAG: YqiJ family protein [Proteobacteria bacterium]|nr:YqiJ family protein [Pseudomonadota bacterium]
MANWFYSDSTWVFSLAILIMMGLGVLELIGLILGASLSGLVDNSFDVDADINTGIHVDHVDGIDHGLLGWLHLGRVPFLVLLVILLSAFGASGLILQWSQLAFFGAALPIPVAIVPPLFIAVLSVRVFGGLFARILPKDESSAVSRDSLIGRVAVTGANSARTGLACEARVKDSHEGTHYVMVEPEEPYESLNSGAEVLLVRRKGARFMAIPNPHSGIMKP